MLAPVGHPTQEERGGGMGSSWPGSSTDENEEGKHRN
eukprot:CAMPEP_0174283314 /NCGR_PEP_ID=MMETSP0809-20121228/3980_1 /TAXON_ID=73025 ORGANISM="Eutreptiella gymnastica-like, Strain CCMP1594" /NCGR_SAMPLE_ID=MMETSP0809 /ASSEMBLY_ACC=CAM_ASM_000658 /LENGTH=36 /DNA_ID= /DNA_START= /DNA_END= /DNA_ORIENTATION=